MTACRWVRGQRLRSPHPAAPSGQHDSPGSDPGCRYAVGLRVDRGKSLGSGAPRQHSGHGMRSATGSGKKPERGPGRFAPWRLCVRSGRRLRRAPVGEGSAALFPPPCRPSAGGTVAPSLSWRAAMGPSYPNLPGMAKAGASPRPLRALLRLRRPVGRAGAGRLRSI
jgi:hypothetical protein